MYAQLRAELAADDRLRNNLVSFMAPGELCPPVVLSEMLANPQGALGTEWIEIKSISSGLVDLSGWTISDAVSSHVISTASMMIESDDYLVLADDTSLFTDYYMPPDNDPVQPPTWPILNNDGDVVVLTDSYGIEADRFEFTAPFDSNYTWSRVEPVDYNGRWGRSENMGGSPGQTNRVVLVTEGSSIAINVQPKIFSPNDDWVDETTVLTVEAPESDEYTLEIYDRQGRVVKTFMDKESFLRVEYEWDGYSDDGKRLPIGIYIVYFEAAGIESIKETVVIAR